MKPALPRYTDVLIILVSSLIFQVPAQARTSVSAATGNIAQLAVVAPVKTCAALRDADLSDIGGQGSRVVTASESTRDGIATCVVEGRLAPEIGFRLELPTGTWAQRYLQVGCGGLCGNINPTPLNTGRVRGGSYRYGASGSGRYLWR